MHFSIWNVHTRSVHQTSSDMSDKNHLCQTNTFATQDLWSSAIDTEIHFQMCVNAPGLASPCMFRLTRKCRLVMYRMVVMSAALDAQIIDRDGPHF